MFPRYCILHPYFLDRCIGKIVISFSYFDANIHYLIIFPHEYVKTVKSILIELAKLLFLVQEYL